MRTITTRLTQTIQWWLEPTRFTALALTFLSLILLAVFIRLHDENLAWGDELRAFPMVMAIRQGSFSPAYLFQNFGGHYNVPTYLTIALLTVLTDWNLKVGVVISVVLACLILMLLTSVFAADRRRTWVYIIPAFAALIFSVHQDLNWTGPYVGHWFFSIFFFAAALVMLVRYPDSWRGVALAVVFSVISTFASGNGVFCWMALIPVIAARGFRHWKYYAFWGVSALIAVALFASGLRGAMLDDGQALGLASRLAELARFELIFLGAIFISRANLVPGALDTVAFSIGAAGVGLFIANAALLWRSESGRRTVLTWTAPAGYAVLSGLAIGMTRVNSAFWARPYIAWYATFTNLFWIALIALAYAVIEQGWSVERINIPRVGTLANLGALVGLLMVHIIQNNRISETSYVSLDPNNHIAGSAITEQCADYYLRTLNGDCLKEWLPSTTLIASYHLNMFAGRQPISILPESYSVGEPMVIETANGWHGVAMRDWMLAGLDPQDTFYVFPHDDWVLEEMGSLQEPLANIATTLTRDDLDRLRGFLTSADAFWMVRKADLASRLDNLIAELVEAGYAADEPVIYEAGNIVMLRYSQRD